ncbi:ATP-dependent DNA helicase [Novymonas esmeraldas]|uniref:DNA 3'-5' helicase n=1 Tax=Novymonas esmeraldas TaxID=1808958 RepID=A0AAW0EUX7_9TRYP
MQEVRDALVAVSEGSHSGVPLPHHSAAAPPPHVARAPRTSFAYTSRPSPSDTSVAASQRQPAVNVVAPHTATTGVSSSVDDGQRCSVRDASAEATSTSSPPPPPPLAAASAPPHSCLPALSRMDASQARAVTHPVGAALLLQAGAGSGKTQTMAARIAFLLQSGVPGHSILGICFTRQAAETLRERVRSTLPPSLATHAHALKLKTFHAFGLECLRRFGTLAADTPVLDARQQHQLARRVVDTYAQREKSSEAVADLVDYVNRVKTMKVPPIPQSDPGVQDAYLFPYYQRALHEEQNAVDFGDLQQMFYELLRPVAATAPEGCGGGAQADVEQQQQQQQQQQPSPSPPERGRLVPSYVCRALRTEYTHFVVDEFQDFNEIQVELLALLAGDACRVTCVGDPNQCIYTWRGALPNVFGVWKKRFPQTTLLTLAMNYRSDGPIVEAANRVVAATQVAHHHREERAVTLVQCANEEEEAQAVPLVVEHVLRRRDASLSYGDVVILCRSRKRVQFFCDVLQSQRIPVRQLKGMAVDHLATMRSLLALLRLCVSPHGPEGDADVRTVLHTAPLHRLPAGAAKKFLFSLDSVCQARRTTEAAHIRTWRHTMQVEDDSIGTGTGGGGGGGRGAATAAASSAETHSFFAVLQELVYHNFAREAFPKLDVSKKNQKSIRSLVRIVVHAKDLLAQPSCDVEHLLRYVLREGGYDSDSTVTVAARTATAASGAKRSRDLVDEDGDAGEAPVRRSATSSYQPRVAALLMDQCASQHNQQQQQQQQQRPQLHSSSAAAAPCHTTNGGVWERRHNTGRRSGTAAVGGGGAEEEDILPAEEEAAVWREQRMNLSELVLHTCRTVQATLQREVAHELDNDGGAGEGRGDTETPLPHAHAASPSNSNSRSQPFSRLAGADNSMSNGSTTTTTTTVMQALRPPAVVLRRILDEFVSLVSSDDYGPMRDGGGGPDDTAAAADPARPSSHWIGHVTVGTVHRAKGMEWPAVLLPGCWVGEYPVRPREEEKRVFYVGMSRAMKHLICFTAAAREGGTSGVAAATSSTPAAVVDVLASHSHSNTLEPTPYLAAVGDKLERVAYMDLKTAYLKEQGYM